jgi:hypothetical protein
MWVCLPGSNFGEALMHESQNWKKVSSTRPNTFAPKSLSLLKFEPYDLSIWVIRSLASSVISAFGLKHSCKLPYQLLNWCHRKMGRSMALELVFQ